MKSSETAEERADRVESVKRKFADEGKALKAKGKKKLKGKTNVAVVKKGDEPKLSVEQAEKKLTPIANEINVRFEKVAKLDGQADDHRLAAALRLSEAKSICAASGVRFKEWAAANIKEQSWETVRKLASVGGAPNPQIALEDMRGKNREANRQLREKKKTRELANKVFGPAEALLAAKPDEALKATRAFAADNGMELLSKTEVKELKQKAKSAEMKTEEPLTLEGLKTAFGALSAKDKMEFVHWSAGEVGGRFVSALEPSPGDAQETSSDDPLHIPPSLRRTRKT
jgi:hypothetical protein